MSIFRTKTAMVTPETALAGRPDYAYAVPETHFINGHRIREPFEVPELKTAIFGMGCFWGAERLFWETPGVYSTAVGYAGGFSTYPTYEEVCSGRTGHSEVVRVIFDPQQIRFAELLTVFFEGHDPTQGMRQGNDVGTQYRSVAYYADDAQREQIQGAVAVFTQRLHEAGFGAVSTEVAQAGEFYYAEGYHQQYLGKNPDGYCGLGGTGVSCPVGLISTAP